MEALLPEHAGAHDVVDSSDKERVHIAREELQKMLTEDELKDAVLLVLAKQAGHGSDAVCPRSHKRWGVCTR